MTNWRDIILRDFTPGVARVSVAYDPDGLLAEQRLVDAIQQRGLEILPFEDDVQFRFAYESRFRSQWDSGLPAEVVVLAHCRPDDNAALPFDVVGNGRVIAFSLADLFPQLSYPVVASLCPDDLDALYTAVSAFGPGQMGENATKEFVLRHVFEIAPELIKSPVDLLRMLLRRHFTKRPVPTVLDERLIAILRSHGAFGDWPLEKLVPDRGTFLLFLQERWRWYLNSLIGTDSAEGDAMVAGPRVLPFNHDDVRVYIDNYFVDGLLQAVVHSASEKLTSSWMSVGVVSDPVSAADRRIDRLCETIADAMPSADAHHREWARFAYRWAELQALVRSTGRTTLHPAVEGQLAAVESAFSTWLSSHYGGLASLPPSPPTMVHHVPRAISRHVERGREAKAAMLVIDGMSISQWIAIRDALHERCHTMVFEEDAVFAWLPTLTSVSRQSLFAGMPPLYFPDSIGTTSHECALWERFWSGHGLLPREVGYLRGLGKGTVDELRALASCPEVRVLGLVVDMVDRIMHGMELGAAGMQNQVSQWARSGYLSELMQVLVDGGFSVTIVADHGNVEAVGGGRLMDGALSEVRGQRVRVCESRELAGRIAGEYPGSRPGWYPGSPTGYYPVYAPPSGAFVSNGERVVAHGGDSLEEVLVPYITVGRAGEAQ